MARWVTKKDNSSYKSVFWSSFFGFLFSCTFPYLGLICGIIGVFSIKYSSSIKNTLHKKGTLYSLIPSCLLQLIGVILINNLFNKFQNTIILIIFLLILISSTIIIIYINKNDIIPQEEDWKKYYYYKFNNMVARRNKSGLSYTYEFYINNEWCLNSNLSESLNKAIDLSKKSFGVNKYLISYEEAMSLLDKNL